MATIDYTNIMTDDEAGYLPENQIFLLKEYYKQKAKANTYPKQQKRLYAKGLLIWATYRMGRRIGEMVGKRPHINYPGLRPCDFLLGKSIIRFHILKKGHVKRKTKTGATRDIELVKRELFHKKPLIKRIAVDKNVYNTLISYIKKYEIGYYDRIFPYTVRWCDYFIKKAAFHIGLKLPGEKIIKGKKYPKRVHFHQLRHSFAINLIKKNPNKPALLPILQDLLCHSSLEVTKVYMQFSQEDRIKFLTESFSPDKTKDKISMIEEKEKEEK